MTEGSELHDLFDLATDRIGDQSLAGAALTAAGQRRRRRRTAAAAATVIAVVAAVVAPFVVTRGGASDPDPAPVPAPAPAPTSGVTPAPSVAEVQPPLSYPLELPQERSLQLPPDLTAGSDQSRLGGVVLAMQTRRGRVTLVRASGRHDDVAVTGGELFRHSLAPDGGAVALRTDDGFTIYSVFADDYTDYAVTRAGGLGLWLGDSVGFVHDVPGPGGVTREHEPPFSEDRVAFPAGGDLDEMDAYPSGGADEILDGVYVRWLNYQDEARRVDLRRLGDLHGPAAGAERVALVRSGSDADGVLVIDRAGTPQSLLPVVGADIDDVVLHHWVDESRLLLQVADRLVLWDVDAQRLSQVSVLPPGAVVSISDGDGSLVRR